MRGKYLWVLVALCGMATASLGICMNTAGLFYRPIAESLGVGIGDVSLIVTILMVASSFTSLLMPRFLNENTLRKIILAGLILMGGGTFLMAMANNVFVLYACSVLRGFGSGLTNFVLVTTVLNNWYYKQHGLITSIALAFSGIPGVFLSPIITGVINSAGWRAGMMFVGGVIVVSMLPAFLCGITIKPEAQGLKPYGYDDFMKEKEKGNIRLVRKDDKDFYYNSPKFYLAALFMVLVCFAAAVPNYMPAYAESVGFLEISGVILSMTLAGNIVSKILYGMIIDKFNAKIAIVLFALISIVALFPLMWHGNSLVVLISAFAFNFTAANSSVGVSIITSDLFGEANYSKAYPILSFIGSYALAAASAVIGYVFDFTGSYTPIWILIIAMQAMVILSTLMAYGIVDKQEA